MKFNLIGITPDSVQRNFKLVYDFRKEETNERKSIFEIGQFNHYCLIHKKNGEVVRLYHAQNALALVLKHFK